MIDDQLAAAEEQNRKTEVLLLAVLWADDGESPRVSYFDDWKLASLGSQDVTDTRSLLFFLQETQARCAIFGRRDDLCQTVRQFLKGW